MLKHVVMWKLKAFAEGKTRTENALWMKQNLERLVGSVPGVKQLQVGVNICEDEMAYDAVLISLFESDADLAAYKVHPEHVKISAYCKKIRESRVVVDFYE